MAVPTLKDVPTPLLKKLPLSFIKKESKLQNCISAPKKFILVLPAEPALKPATASSKMTLAIKQSSSVKKPMGSLWALLSTTQLLTEAFAVYWIECSS